MGVVSPGWSQIYIFCTLDNIRKMFFIAEIWETQGWFELQENQKNFINRMGTPAASIFEHLMKKNQNVSKALF